MSLASRLPSLKTSLLVLGGIVLAGTGARAQQPVVFENVTVVDVESGRLIADQQVVIVGNRIHAVGKSVRRPEGAHVIDLRGKYLMPGLWDMHVHVLGEGEAGALTYAGFVAAGVTGVRDMSTPHFDSVLQWRREFLTGTRVGPRVVTAGPSVGYLGEGTEPAFNDAQGHTFQLRVSTPDEGRRVVDSLHAAGVDFLKIYPSFMADMPPDVYFAMLSEARRVGLPVAGHPPTQVSAAEASDSGQRSFEHLTGDVGTGVDPDGQPTANSFFAPCWQDDTASVQQCRALAQTFVRNASWFTPTLAIWLRGRREGELPTVPPTAPAGDLALMRRLHDAGFPFLAGTDHVLLEYVLTQTTPSPAAILRQGREVHAELGLLVAAGLTPLEALRAATLNPAKYFGATDSLGTVAPGRLADLLVLDADPLADIHNTTAIRAVVANGRYFDRTALDTLLTDLTRGLGGP